MPAIDFPSAPAVNDEYSFEGRTWLWNGTGWEVKPFPAALQLGTAANPSLYFTGDTNTGIYSPGADHVAISTNGTGRLFVAADGSVGIGHTPTAIFSVLGNARVQTSASGSVGYEIYNGTRNTGISSDFTNSVTFIDHNQTLVFRDSQNVYAERMRLDSSGRLGLGTSSPEVTFQVGNVSSGGSATNKGSIQINDAPTGFTSNGGLEFKSSDFGSGFGWRLISYNSSGNHFALGNRANSATWTQRITVLDSGNVGIGTTSPGANLHISSSGNTETFIGAASGSSVLTMTANVGAGGGSNVGFQGPLIFSSVTGAALAGASERARIDSSGRLLMGASAARGVGAQQHTIQIEGTGSGTGLSLVRNSNDANEARLTLGKSRGTIVGSATVVQNGDYLGVLEFAGADGTDLLSRGALIAGVVDGTPGSDDLPTRLEFSTTADGASSPTERLRITSAGVLQVADAGNITVGTTTGTKIGTATTQKLGFFDKTPVVQPAAVADATDAASAITQLNALLARMRDLGLIAT